MLRTVSTVIVTEHSDIAAVSSNKFLNIQGSTDSTTCQKRLITANLFVAWKKYLLYKAAVLKRYSLYKENACKESLFNEIHVANLQLDYESNRPFATGLL